MNTSDIDRLINSYYDNFDNYIVIPNKVRNCVENIQLNKRHIDIILLIKKIIMTIIGIITISGGLVFAKNYFVKTLGLGEGIDSAVENGYIYQDNNDMIINGKETNVAIKEFLMDNQNISTVFDISLSDEIKEKINMNEIKRIEIEDLIITDENKNILYCNKENALQKYCEENNLKYKFSEFNSNYYNCGLNSFIDKEDEKILLTYNIYSDDYPKSKNLIYKFNNIKLIKDEENNLLTINGEWVFNKEVPEKMYNREFKVYKVLECPNNNIQNITAKATDTGFEIGFLINNVKIPEALKMYRKAVDKYQKDEISEKDYERIIEETGGPLLLDPVMSDYEPEFGDLEDDCTYIENEKGEKFFISSNPGRKQKNEWITENNFNYYDTFELTKYDCTDTLTLHLVIYDEKVNIKLSK